MHKYACRERDRQTDRQMERKKKIGRSEEQKKRQK